MDVFVQLGHRSGPGYGHVCSVGSLFWPWLLTCSFSWVIVLALVMDTFVQLGHRSGPGYGHVRSVGSSFWPWLSQMLIILWLLYTDIARQRHTGYQKC